MTPPWFVIYVPTGTWSVSAKLVRQISLGLEELARIREQLLPLIAKTSDPTLGVLETAAASAMLHSFYTEIEKTFKLVARECDGDVPANEAWHRTLLHQMAAPRGSRPAVITSELMEVLGEFLAFRHLFRGASIALMRWDKLSPLVAKT